MPGTQPWLSVKVLTGFWASTSVQYSSVSSAPVMHSVKGYVLVRPNAAFEDCAREGMLSVAVGSISAASPVRRSGSKWLSTISRPPFAPALGSAVSLDSTWFVLP